MFVSCSISQIGSPHEEAKVPLKISLEGRAACGGLCAAATSAMTHQMGDKFEDLKKDILQDAAAMSRSPFLLMLPVLGTTKLDAQSFRDRAGGAWSTIGVIAALIVTMCNYTDIVECDDYTVSLFRSASVCNCLHPILSFVAMLSCTVSAIMSTILYMMIGFVPDEHIREWAQGISWIVEAPTFSFIAGAVAWAVDILLQGIVKHGQVGLALGGCMVVVGLAVVATYLKIKTITNQLLLRAYAETQ